MTQKYSLVKCFYNESNCDQNKDKSINRSSDHPYYFDSINKCITYNVEHCYHLLKDLEKGNPNSDKKICETKDNKIFELIKNDFMKQKKAEFIFLQECSDNLKKLLEKFLLQHETYALESSCRLLNYMNLPHHYVIYPYIIDPTLAETTQNINCKGIDYTIYNITIYNKTQYICQDITEISAHNEKVKFHKKNKDCNNTNLCKKFNYGSEDYFNRHHMIHFKYKENNQDYLVFNVHYVAHRDIETNPITHYIKPYDYLGTLYDGVIINLIDKLKLLQNAQLQQKQQSCDKSKGKKKKKKSTDIIYSPVIIIAGDFNKKLTEEASYLHVNSFKSMHLQSNPLFKDIYSYWRYLSFIKLFYNDINCVYDQNNNINNPINQIDHIFIFKQINNSYNINLIDNDIEFLRNIIN